MYKKILDPTTKAPTDAGIIRLSDGAYIPADPLNTDYVEYLAWVSAGGVPLPADGAV